MSDDDRKPGQEDDADEATQFRGKREAADDDRTQLRGGDGTPEPPEGEDEDETMLRAKPRAPQDVDDEEPTEFRGGPGAAKEDLTSTTVRPGSPVDQEDATELRGSREDLSSTTIRPGSPVDQEDATELRGSREDLSSTTIRPGSPVDQEDATELRGGSDVDATEINSLTQSMPTVGRASLGPARDAPRLKENAGAVGDGDSDATFLRGSPGATESDATRLRADALPSDDEETVVGADLDDDDATVQALGVPPADEDATVQAAGGRAGLSDDDATQQAGGRDDDPTVQGGSASRPPPPPRPRGAQPIGPGTVLKGRFTLEDKLGAGGMGGVFKAVDLVKKEARDRNPYVAVKVLNEAFAEHEDSFLALQRESSRSQRLTHPNIAAVYDFDRDGDTAYMVMELLEGSPLDSYLKKNKQGLDPEQARDIIRDIASALAYAHTQTPALVHSDFKPGNIFFTNDGAAKVFDFGIARAATETSDDVIKNEGMDVDALVDDADDGTLFDAGKLGALTPAYAAVEMFEGRDPAPQDDVYALGIVAYQCITGKHPFNRQKAPVAAAQGMVPERPPGVTNREWRAIKRALEFKREDRTPDAQAFLDEFFYTGTKTLLAVAATAAIMAIGVGALYFGGVIGPQAPTASPNPDWVALESEISVPRRAVARALEDTDFQREDLFVAWEGVIRQNVEAWDAVDRPTIVLEETVSGNQAAIDAQKRIFETTGLSVAIAEPSSALGRWALTAGPFPSDEEIARGASEEGARERLTFDQFRQALDEYGIAYRIEDDVDEIAEARDEALDVYLAWFDRRMPDTLPDVRPVIRVGDELYRGVAPSTREGTEAFRLLKEEAGFWVPDPEAVAEIGTLTARVRALGMDEDPSDRSRGPSVLARAEDNFPTRPEDIAAARQRARNVVAQLEAELSDAQRLATNYVQDFTRSQQTFEDEAARRLERDNVAAARRDGNEGEPIELSYTYAELGFDAPTAVEFPGVFKVFSRECNQPERVQAALEDYPYLAADEQAEALELFVFCADNKLVRHTDSVLESKQLLLAQVDSAPIASIERPDPCSARGYVGAGRNASCRDQFSGGSAPPVVVIDGPGDVRDYGIGKYEVSAGEYNAFARVLGRPQLPGADREPARGLTLEDARAYTAWLSRQTGRTYRLPTEAEWLHAAAAGNSPLDPNRNCYSNVRGVVRGDSLVSVGQGAPNDWGLVNHLGNVEEWAIGDDGVVALGGRHTDDLSSCTLEARRPDAGEADDARGFRVLREIDQPGALIAGIGGN